MTVHDITHYLDQWAPPSLQESYDNAGLLVGEPDTDCTGVVVTLDITEAVVQEAIDNDCNLIVAHHPIIFGGLKRLTGRNYVERTVMLALRNNIALYATHTNLDNVASGVNKKIADRIGLQEPRILAPKSDLLKKLFVFVPHDHAAEVRHAIFEAGAGHIGQYDSCSYNVQGTGTFRGLEGTNPYVGQQGEVHQEPETKIEVIFPAWQEGAVLQAMQQAHPYEEVAYDIVALDNAYQEVGSGMIGELVDPMDEMTFLEHLQTQMETDCIRYTALRNQPVKRVAVCGGAGSFLLSTAIKAGADAFITGDFKYHQFFDADGQIVIADIGHFESEQFTIELIAEKLREKFSNFAVRLTEINTNPIQYLS